MRMHWNQIKTLLILSFLILNGYLLIQFLEKREQEDIATLDHSQSSVEEQLKSDSIKINELPKEQSEESYISVKPQLFTEKELESVNQTNQNLIIANKNLIVSQLEEPIPIKEDSRKKDLENMLDDIILYAEDYTFWNWDKDLNVLIYFQEKDDRPIYYNQNGLLLFFVNDHNEVVFYTQTYLGETEPRAEKRELITPLKAIEILYSENELDYGDEITSVNIGFHTRVPLESGVQVFAPIWKVNVNDQKNYFINAIEGVVFSSDEREFLKEAIETNLERIEAIEDDEVMRATLLNILENKLE